MHAYSFAAVLFDMDGTIIDKVSLNQAVWRGVAAQHQVHLSEQQLRHVMGRKAAEFVNHLWPQASPDEVADLSRSGRSCTARSRHPIHLMFRLRSTAPYGNLHKKRSAESILIRLCDSGAAAVVRSSLRQQFGGRHGS